MESELFRRYPQRTLLRWFSVHDPNDPYPTLRSTARFGVQHIPIRKLLCILCPRMAMTEAPPPSAPKPRKARKKSAKASSAPVTPHNRTVDIEAVGLVLLGVAVFFGASLYLQLRPLEGLKTSVIGAMGWSAYLIPVPFLVFGFLAFIRQNARLAARVMLGLSVMAFAGLLGTGLYEPKLAGSFANGIAGPARAVMPLAIMGVLFIASIGLEITLGWRRTTIARATAKGTSLLVSKTASFTGQAAVKAKDATQRIAVQVGLRAQLDSVQKDIAELLKIYPGSSELSAWTRDASDAADELSQTDDAALARLKDDVSRWRSLISGFTQSRAKDLAETLPTEDAGAENLILEAQKHLQNAVLGTNPAAKNLENLRRTLQLDAKTLEEAHNRSKREREFASKALGASLRPADLRIEIEHHQARGQTAKSIRVRAEALLTKTAPLHGWHDFMARLEGKLEPEYVEFTQELSSAIHNGGADVLPELLQWSVDLDHLERDLMKKTQEAASWWEKAGSDAPPIAKHACTKPSSSWNSPAATR
jgi:DNA segregation ATPase FtsK/SpoIIIE, S-DNA-T family